MDFALARHNMVESQVRPNRVTDPAIVAALAELPREMFVPKGLRGVAYADEALPLGNGRFLMEPMILGRLLQVAAVRSTDVALDIGCGTGYAAAVLSRLASAVVAVESDHELAARATRLLGDLGITTAAVVEGPLGQGYAKQAPYDVIFFDGAVSTIPVTVVDQLAEGGRLVAVVVQAGDGMGRGVLVTRVGGVVSRREIFDAGSPLLPEFAPVPKFVF